MNQHYSEVMQAKNLECGVIFQIASATGRETGDSMAKNLWSAMWKEMNTGVQSSGTDLRDYGCGTVNCILPNPFIFVQIRSRLIMPNFTKFSIFCP
jgi:hypothetical protein